MKHSSLHNASTDPLTIFDLFLRQPKLSWLFEGEEALSHIRLRRFIRFTPKERAEIVAELASVIAGKTEILSDRSFSTKDLWKNQETVDQLAHYFHCIDRLTADLPKNWYESPSASNEISQFLAIAYAGVVQALQPLENKSEKGSLSDQVAGFLAYGIAVGFPSPRSEHEVATSFSLRPYAFRKMPFSRSEILDIILNRKPIQFGFLATEDSFHQLISEELSHRNPHALNPHRNSNFDEIMRLQAWFGVVSKWTRTVVHPKDDRRNSKFDSLIFDFLEAASLELELPSSRLPPSGRIKEPQIDPDIIFKELFKNSLPHLTDIYTHRQWDLEARDFAGSSHANAKVAYRPVKDDEGNIIVSRLTNEPICSLDIQLKGNPTGAKFSMIIEVAGCEDEVGVLKQALALAKGIVGCAEFLSEAGLEYVSIVATNPDGAELNKTLVKAQESSYREGLTEGVRPNVIQASWGYEPNGLLRINKEKSEPGSLAVYQKARSLNTDSLMVVSLHGISVTPSISYIDHPDYRPNDATSFPARLIGTHPTATDRAAPDGTWIESAPFFNPLVPTKQSFEAATREIFGGRNSAAGILKSFNLMGGLLDIGVYRFLPSDYDLNLTEDAAHWIKTFNALNKEAALLLRARHPELEKEEFTLENFHAKAIINTLEQEETWPYPVDTDAPSADHVTKMSDLLVLGPAFPRRLSAVARLALLWSDQQRLSAANTRLSTDTKSDCATLASKIEKTIESYANAVSVSLQPKLVSDAEALEYLTGIVGRLIVARSLTLGRSPSAFMRSSLPTAEL